MPQTEQLNIRTSESTAKLFRLICKLSPTLSVSEVFESWVLSASKSTTDASRRSGEISPAECAKIAESAPVNSAEHLTQTLEVIKARRMNASCPIPLDTQSSDP